MNTPTRLTLLVFLASLFACVIRQEHQEENGFSTSNVGYYVTESYDKRQEGFDWMGISIRQENDSIFSVSVRSRSDLKKPTCTFDGHASANGHNQLKSIFENKSILFTFTDNQLEVSMENEQDEGLLYFFCSGGGSLKGKYKKLEKTMDASQLNSTDFEKKLSLQGISFDVLSSTNGFDTELIVKPSNLEIDNSPTRQMIDGSVTGAEIEDMNSDGSPELLIYTKSMNGGMFGHVIAYSVNNRKSMSQVYLPNIIDNPKVNQGYFGYDEFTMVETKLGRRFPLFKETNGKLVRTGKMRQISYTLEDGEAQRRFKIEQVSEY